jgi:murein L,D-transpeptidase YcbB/YkuD
VVSKKTGEPNDDINSVVDMLMSIDKSGEKVEESNVYEQEVKTPFKPVIMGEKSDRVKIIQKYLGLKEDGVFGELTKKAVEKFQTENKLKIDGKVGEQTYSKMLEIKLNIKDKSEISKKSRRL